MFAGKRRVWFIAGPLVALTIIGAGTGLALGGGMGDDDQPLTGTALEQASAAALAHTGGGTVIETEGGDDGAAYGVEVRLDDGSVVEVSLDAQFNVTDQETDDDGPGDQDGADDD